MPLTLYDNEYNHIVLLALIEKHFQQVANVEQFGEIVSKILDEREIALRIYTGLHTKRIIECMRSMVVGNLFVVGKAQEVIDPVIEEIRKLEANERELYKNQNRIVKNITEQLKQQGYVETNHLPTHDDIKQALTAAKLPAGTLLSDPISLTDDEGGALKATLKAYKDQPGKLMIPINLYGNHWVLLVREQSLSHKNPAQIQNVTVTIKDSLPEPEVVLANLPLKILNTIVADVYAEKSPHRTSSSQNIRLLSKLAAVREVRGETEHKTGMYTPVDEDSSIVSTKQFATTVEFRKKSIITIGYVYTGEQNNDVTTCGQRVCRSICIEASVDNSLTHVPPDNPDLLSTEFIKLVAQSDSTLQKEKLGVLQEAGGPFIYNVETANNSKQLQEAIQHKKYFQEKADEHLAIVLQEIYYLDPDVDPDDAFKEAQKRVRELNPKDLESKKNELNKWCSPHFNRFSANLAISFFGENQVLAQNCGEAARSEQEGVTGDSIYHQVSL